MSTEAPESQSAIRIADSDSWIVFPAGAPIEVALELEGLEATKPADLTATRSIFGGAEVILGLVFGGVVGNAAWAAIPKTVGYVKSLRSRNLEPIQSAEAAAEMIHAAARSIHGPDAAVEIHGLTQAGDGAWECEALLGEHKIAARVDPAGLLVAWVETDVGK